MEAVGRKHHGSRKKKSGELVIVVASDPLFHNPDP